MSITNKFGLITPKGYAIFDITQPSVTWNQVVDNIHVIDVYDDSKGNTWFATLEQGLWIQWANGSIEKHNIDNGLPSNRVYGIKEDNRHNIWVLTSNASCRYNNDTREFRIYNSLNGLQKSSNQSFLAAKNGTFFIGGEDGFNTFSPDNLLINKYIPAIYIDDFYIYNKPVTLTTPNTPLIQTIEETKELTLSYTDTVFSFGFTAINFTYPENAKYAYKMEGFDKHWIYTNASNRKATYTNLNPGTYTFMVKASNNDDVWNETPTTLIIHIIPPWYKTLFFRVLLLVLLIGGPLGFYFFRVNSLKRRQYKLEHKVKMRTEQLQQANSLLERRQSEIIQQNIELEGQSNKIKEMDMLKTRFFIIFLTNFAHHSR